VRRAETVREARMFCALVGVKTKAELFDSTKALELRCVDQLDDQSTLGVIAQRNDVVNRVAVDALRQFLGPVIKEFGRGSLTQGVVQRDAELMGNADKQYSTFLDKNQKFGSRGSAVIVKSSRRGIVHVASSLPDSLSASNLDIESMPELSEFFVSRVIPESIFGFQDPVGINHP